MQIQSFTRPRRQSEVFKELRDLDYVCDQGIIPAGSQVNGSASFDVGTVLGKITTGTITVAPPSAASGNVGDGTCALGAPAYDTDVKVGTYRLVAISTTAWEMFDPNGDLVGVAADGEEFADEIRFTITSGGTAFAAGDEFTIVVSAAAASGAFVQINPVAGDGSQNFAGILARSLVVNAAHDTPASIATRGPTIVVKDNLVWPAGMSGAAQAAALAQADARGIKAIAQG